MCIRLYRYIEKCVLYSVASVCKRTRASTIKYMYVPCGLCIVCARSSMGPRACADINHPLRDISDRYHATFPASFIKYRQVPDIFGENSYPQACPNKECICVGWMFRILGWPNKQTTSDLGWLGMVGDGWGVTNHGFASSFPGPGQHQKTHPGLRQFQG